MKGKHLHKFIYIYITKAGNESELAALGEAKNNTCYQYSSIGAFKGPALEPCTTRAKVNSWLESMGARREAMPPAVIGADGPGVTIRARKYSGYFTIDKGVQDGQNQRLCRFFYLQGNDGVLDMAAMGVEHKPKDMEASFIYWRKPQIPSTVLEPCASKEEIIEFLASVGAKMQHRPPKSAMNILPDTLELDVDDQNKPIMPLLSLRSVSKSQLSGSQAPRTMEATCTGCAGAGDSAAMLFCDDSHEGWHIDCLPSKLRSMPHTTFYCPFCSAVRAAGDVAAPPENPGPAASEIPCKHCGHTSADTSDMLFCEDCSVGYHLTCLPVPLLERPADSWYCPACCARRAKVMISKRKVEPRERLGSSQDGLTGALSPSGAGPSFMQGGGPSAAKRPRRSVRPEFAQPRHTSSDGFDDPPFGDDDPDDSGHGRKRHADPPRRVMTDPVLPRGGLQPGSLYDQPTDPRLGSSASSPPERGRDGYLKGRGRGATGSRVELHGERSSQPFLGRSRSPEREARSSDRTAALALRAMEAHARRGHGYSRETLSPPYARHLPPPPTAASAFTLPLPPHGLDWHDPHSRSELIYWLRHLARLVLTVSERSAFEDRIAWYEHHNTWPPNTISNIILILQEMRNREEGHIGESYSAIARCLISL
mmetsp:Transcript_41788/g.108164  ORF Transcript_41788/g.108164 Transcript_41788/m.108164 type:complete len:651 (-) Transcript_41788:350-2302(-)